MALTTVLARQHLETVRRRFAGTDVRVEGLIRGADASEARAVRRALADGSVGVVVGTHGLASERVGFAWLGLVVVDEGQRFGDAHKVRFSGLAGGEPVAHVPAIPPPRIPAPAGSTCGPDRAHPCRLHAGNTCARPCAGGSRAWRTRPSRTSSRTN